MNQLDHMCLNALEVSHTHIHQAIQSLKDGNNRQCKEKVQLAIAKAVSAIVNL